MPKSEKPPEAENAPSKDRVNIYLKEQVADEDDVSELEAMMEDQELGVCQILDALAQISYGADDEIGMTLIREFRVRYAAHEIKDPE